MNNKIKKKKVLVLFKTAWKFNKNGTIPFKSNKTVQISFQTSPEKKRKTNYSTPSDAQSSDLGGMSVSEGDFPFIFLLSWITRVEVVWTVPAKQ